MDKHPEGQELHMAAKKKPEEGKSLEENMESSPYVNYGDLEDYKRKAYGTQGHLEPQIGRGAGGTEAPTLSGADVPKPDAPAADVSTTGLP